MERITHAVPVVELVPSLARFEFAAPSWTKTGDCASGHMAVVPGALHLASFDTRANPNNHQRFAA